MRSFLKSSCLIPFVWFQLVPATLIYWRVKIIIFKAYCLRGLHLSSPWSQKRSLAVEYFFLCFLVMKTSTFCVVAALRMSIQFQPRELHFLHMAGVGVAMQSLRLLLEASTSWEKKVIEYWLFFVILSTSPMWRGVCPSLLDLISIMK